MTEELRTKILGAILKTGYPLELELATVAEKKGWVVFHAVEYDDPLTGKSRELDLLLYKQVQERRIELRISCKSSQTKQFVFFTENRTNHVRMGELKRTPVTADLNWQSEASRLLLQLPIFSHPDGVVNYTVTTGNAIDREARTLLRDAIMSVVSSAHYRLLPYQLLFDERGTVYFFLVVLRGAMFTASFDRAEHELLLKDAEYAIWHGKIPMPDKYMSATISDAGGRPIKFGNVLYWFGDRIDVEVVKDTQFPEYLEIVEKAFETLNADQLKMFGKPWRHENFPKVVGPAPRLEPQDAKLLRKNHKNRDHRKATTSRRKKIK